MKNNLTLLYSKSKLFLFVIAILYKLSLEFTYINFLHIYYEHNYFYLDTNYIKYFESWFFFLFFLILTPQYYIKPSDFFINFFLYVFIVPLLSYYSFNNSDRLHLYIILGNLLLIYFFKTNQKIKIPTIKRIHNFVFPISAGLIITVLIAMLFRADLQIFNFDLKKVYEFREYTDIIFDQNIFAYLNSWSFKVFGIFFLIIFIIEKKYFKLLLIFLLYFIWFGFFNHKFILFMPFVVLFFYILFNKKNNFILFVTLLLVLICISYILYLSTDEIFYTSIVIRRIFFIPSMLTFKYFEFFSENNFIYWSNSIMSVFIEYNYSTNPVKIIGEYIGTNSHANNSFLSSGYMHAGFYGILFYTLIFKLILWIIDSCSYGKKSKLIVTSITLVPIISLILNSDLPTSLLTHGIFISIVLIFFYNYKLRTYDL